MKSFMFRSPDKRASYYFSIIMKSVILRSPDKRASSSNGYSPNRSNKYKGNKINKNII